MLAEGRRTHSIRAELTQKTLNHPLQAEYIRTVCFLCTNRMNYWSVVVAEGVMFIRFLYLELKSKPPEALEKYMKVVPETNPSFFTFNGVLSRRSVIIYCQISSVEAQRIYFPNQIRTVFFTWEISFFYLQKIRQWLTETNPNSIFNNSFTFFYISIYCQQFPWKLNTNHVLLSCDSWAKPDARVIWSELICAKAEKSYICRWRVFEMKQAVGWVIFFFSWLKLTEVCSFMAQKISTGIVLADLPPKIIMGPWFPTWGQKQLSSSRQPSIQRWLMGWLKLAADFFVVLQWYHASTYADVLKG